jgi:MFS family permease
VFLVVGLPWAPESPWYHIRKNELEAARKALFKLYGDSTDLDAKLAMMVRTVNEDIEATSAARWVQCFTGTNRLRTMVSVMVFACQHLSGIVFVLGFSTYFFQLAGISDDDSFSLGVGVPAVGVIGCMISWALINNFGRRKLFILGMIGMTVVLLLMGILDVVHTPAARWIEASCTVVYALFYQATIGPLAFAILGETPTTSLRAKTIGLATAMQAVFGTLMNVVVPYLVNPDKANLRGKVGFIFGGLCAFGSVWSYLFVPELKGRTFQEIDHLFQNHVSPRKMAEYNIPSFASSYHQQA